MVKAPDRVQVSLLNHYACAKPECGSSHDAAYIREDLATCNRDHCTPEERAVIEAALTFRESLQPWSSRITTAAQKQLISTVDTLVAARAKEGK